VLRQRDPYSSEAGPDPFATAVDDELGEQVVGNRIVLQIGGAIKFGMLDVEDLACNSKCGLQYGQDRKLRRLAEMVGRR
jgi:hypothetical protein